VLLKFWSLAVTPLSAAFRVVALPANATGLTFDLIPRPTPRKLGTPYGGSLR
jgi:hypothetical protein